jgi:hypothetical protein
MLFRSEKPRVSVNAMAPSLKAFDSEMKLVNLFEKMANHKLNSSSGMLREFEGVDGIADIVLFELYKSYEKNLILGNLAPRWVYALRALPYRKNFSTDSFASLTGVSKKTATTALQHYVELGYCKKTKKTQTWNKRRQPIRIVKNIFAIEAKLKDWKRALKQASRYRDYSNQSWVLLDDYTVKPAIQNIHSFIEANIGLASINALGYVNIHFSPHMLEAKSDIRLWQANAEIAKRLNLGF